MLSLKNNKLLQLFSVTAVTVILYVIFYHTQESLTYSFSALFDGNQYLKAYQFFKGQTGQYNVSFPYHSRIMMPFLASLLPYDPINAFNYLNFIFILAGVLSMYILWDMLRFPFYLNLTAIVWLTLHWSGIIRYNLFDPVTVDVPLYLFQSLFLVAVLKNKPWLMILAAVISVINKESIIAFLVILVLYYSIQWIRKEEPARKFWFFVSALTAAVILKAIINNYFPPVEHGRSSLITLLFYARETLRDPFRIVHWLAGLSVAFGPWLALYILLKFRSGKFTKSELLPGILSLTALAISFLGGGDFTRLIFLGFPFIMTWFFYSMKEVKPAILFFTFLTGLPLTMFWRSIPNPAVRGWLAFYNWHPEFAPPGITWLWVGYFFAAGMVLFFIVRKLYRPSNTIRHIS